jgi:hypothetical protein
VLLGGQQLGAVRLDRQGVVAANAAASTRERTRRIVGSDGTRPATPNAAKTSTDWSAAYSAITV